MGLTSIRDLRELILNTLSPLVSDRCALFDLPYYKNIGDVLIWEGEISFLSDIGKDIVYGCSEKTCVYPNLDRDITILFQGGGNIGDIYEEHSIYLTKIVDKYPHNKIIVFPQTVFFKDKVLEKTFFNHISTHNNIIFCCRDWKSYETVSRYIGENALQLPDMAFCINQAQLIKLSHYESNGSLCIRRNDIEKSNIKTESSYDKVCDWPPFEQKYTFPIVINTIFDRIVPLTKSNRLKTTWDRYAARHFKPDMIRTGVEFISQYETVHSERLHGAILSILLNKTVQIIDNSYGKNSTFYESWLTGFPNVNLLLKRR